MYSAGERCLCGDCAGDCANHTPMRSTLFLFSSWLRVWVLSGQIPHFLSTRKVFLTFLSGGVRSAGVTQSGGAGWLDMRRDFLWGYGSFRIRLFGASIEVEERGI